ncbi:hypothetical protein [Prevotella sp. tf2-5]|uniref:hypothetical protein n=1 Tax=Prevotella sp. tf2-5 TaxID=1761889 RepID=UPI0008EEC60F|nr:hypothetical protein [Prevotella sp. tf2-5]SFO72522.1 hypothetical protein SAMN04487852_10613 [Prevotella sp. tf2-5]
MKKFFTLISMALVAMSVNAQDLPEHCYPIKSITWGDITWKNGNNKKDKDNADMYFLMGTGNGYKDIYAEEIYTDGEPTGNYRAYYTYIDYEKGETGAPGYGLYYKFTPSTSGTLKVNVWVNKGNRKTFVVKASDGKPMTPYVDYTFDGYVNGQNLDGKPIYFTATEIKTRHDDFNEEQKAAGKDPVSDYVIEKGNQAVWGWITFNVEAGESYIVYQQSSQLGFGGFEFGSEKYVASPTGGVADAFKAVIDADGKATNVTTEGSVVEFTACGVAVKAVGGAVPTAVVPNLDPTGINNVKKAAEVDANAPIFNLAGQKVDKSQKGILIQNGKKFVNK